MEKVANALCRKIISRETKSFYCLVCLSEYLDTSTEDLLDLAEEFKSQGCTLFERVGRWSTFVVAFDCRI